MIWLALPAIALSSFILATDAPLLFFWTGALYALYLIFDARDKAGSRIVLFSILGALIGLGLLSKYAMIYFPSALIIAVVISREARRALLRPEIFLTAAIAATLVCAERPFGTRQTISKRSPIRPTMQTGRRRFFILENLQNSPARNS